MPTSIKELSPKDNNSASTNNPPQDLGRKCSKPCRQACSPQNYLSECRNAQNNQKCWSNTNKVQWDTNFTETLGDCNLASRRSWKRLYWIFSLEHWTVSGQISARVWWSQYILCSAEGQSWWEHFSGLQSCMVRRPLLALKKSDSLNIESKACCTVTRWSSLWSGVYEYALGSG